MTKLINISRLAKLNGDVTLAANPTVASGPAKPPGGTNNGPPGVTATDTLKDLAKTAGNGLATVAVRRGQVRRDAAVLLESALAELLRDGEEAAVEPDRIEELVSRATSDLAGDDDPTWALADRIARLRDADPESVGLASDWLDVLIRRRADPARGSGRGGPR